jgi:PAS domain S-box-containing protein
MAIEADLRVSSLVNGGPASTVEVPPNVLDAVFPFVLICSPDGVVLDLNQAPTVLSGLRRQDILGRRLGTLPWWSHSPQERHRIEDALRRAALGEKVSMEITVRRLSGGIMYVEAALVPLRDEAGAVRKIVASGVDVTARHEAQAALAASEARLADAQRVAHVGSWEWDVARDTVTWSDELYRIYGLEKGQFAGTFEAFAARVHPDDLPYTRDVIQKALRNSTAFAYDHRVLRPDGSARMLHTRGEVIAGPDAAPARIVGCCWDISERWQAMRSLERSVSLLRSTLEATGDGILVIDLAGEIVAFNQRYLEQWGIPREVAAAGQERALLSLIRDQLEDPQAFTTKMWSLQADPAAESRDVMRLKDGRVFERYSGPQRLEGEIIGRVWSFRDVTQRERLLHEAEAARRDLQGSHDQLRALAARLEEIREEERRLIAREIHDQIGQALTALKLDVGWVHARMHEACPDPNVERGVSARIDRINRTLDETLDTARRVSTELRPAVLDDLGLAAALEWQAQEFESRTGVRVRLELPGPEEKAVDPTRALVLFRILQEALTNVSRHAGAREVHVRLVHGDSALSMTVDDDGRGIAPAALTQTRSLGLAGMRERAFVVGGRVQVAAREGGGTRVTVELPPAPSPIRPGGAA